MGAVNTLVITGYGTNSHLETAHAARLAGVAPEELKERVYRLFTRIFQYE